MSGAAKPLLDLLFEHLPLPGAETALVLLPDGGGAPIHEEWYEDVPWLLVDVPQVLKIAAKAKGGVFYPVLPHRKASRKDRSVPGMAVWADVDFKDYPGGEAEARARLSAFALPPTADVMTGHGLHAFWVMKEPEPADSLVRLSARMAIALGSDPHVADHARILRLPGSVNYKRQPYVTTVLEVCEPTRRYTPYDLDELLPEAPDEPKGTADPVADTVGEGERNAMLASLAGSMRRRGMGEPAILAALLAENATRCVPPLPESEVRRIAASIARYAPTSVTPKAVAKAAEPPDDDGTNGTNGKRPKGLNFDMKRIRTFTSIPAIHELTIAMGDVEVVLTMNTKELTTRGVFKTRVVDALGRVPTLPTKPAQYDALVDHWLSVREVVAQPPEASPAVLLRDRVERAVNNLSIGEEASDLDRGTACLHNGLKVFKAASIIDALRSPDATTQAVCKALRDLGFESTKVWLDGKTHHVWAGPAPEPRRPAVAEEEEPL